MRALIVGSDRVSSWAVAEKLTEAGFTVVGPARSSGEALLLAAMERPEVAVLSVNLESAGAGERLADTLKGRHSMHCILTGAANEISTSDHGYMDQSDHGKIADAVVRHRRQRR